MAENGPLQIRRDTRENIEGVTPSDGELFLATNEADQGTVFSGNGGVLTKSGLSPQDRRDLAGTGGLMPEYDQTSLTLACANSVHVLAGGESGWTVGNISHALDEFIPIVQGDLPAGLIADGGWVDMHLSGRHTKVGDPTQDYLTVRLMVNDTYMGPVWTGQPTKSPGWGFTTLGDNLSDYDDGVGTYDNEIHYELRLRMQCISPEGVELEPSGTPMFWKLSGEFEMFAGEYDARYMEAGQAAYDDTAGTGFRRDVKLIREFSSVGNPQERLNLRLEVMRPAGGADATIGDSNHVHCASMIAYGISPGRQVSRATLGERLV